MDYDRSTLRPRMMHIGFGAFARAHVMVFHDELLRRQNSDWGVVAVRLHSGAEDLTNLDRTGGLYTVGEMSGGDVSLREVGAVVETIHPLRDGMEALLDRVADPELSLITLTITEKGYCIANGHLDVDHADISRDLRAPASPGTAIGVIAEGLRRRRAAGHGPLTILSCDNLPSNGNLCRTAIAEYAERLDRSVAAWILSDCRFPSSMVDRITPAMTDDAQQTLTEALGRPDPNGILCEPFRQWVIEDRFAGERPDWDLAGAEFVADVAPYEEMKLRLLNGTHSFLAYLGALAGFQTIADCMKEPVLVQAARNLMLSEQAPTLDLPEGVDAIKYADTLIERFSNTALHHKTTQIASDGSQKLPQRLLAPIRQHLKAGRDWPLSAFAVAGWLLYCRGTSEQGGTLPVNDPLSGTIAQIAQGADGADFVREMLSLEAIFGDDLPRTPAFSDAVQSAYDQLRSDGVLTALS
ncbi:mannitol dehydrogenase family protein [Roseibium aggregatum]|nr:mannitol dehydrogenase family protein [Roseibium aggregatum]